MHKCMNNMSSEYLRDLVEVKQIKYSFRYENTVKIPTVRTVTYGQRSSRFESVCGIACPMSLEQQRASRSSKV